MCAYLPKPGSSLGLLDVVWPVANRCNSYSRLNEVEDDARVDEDDGGEMNGEGRSALTGLQLKEPRGARASARIRTRFFKEAKCIAVVC